MKPYTLTGPGHGLEHVCSVQHLSEVSHFYFPDIDHFFMVENFKILSCSFLERAVPMATCGHPLSCSPEPLAPPDRSTVGSGSWPR